MRTGPRDPVPTGYTGTRHWSTSCAWACTVPKGPPCARAQLTLCLRASQDGRLRWDLRLPFVSFDPKPIYFVPRVMFRVSKVLDDILVSFAPLPSLFEDQDGVQQQQNSKSQVTPCARAPETPCPWATQEPGAGAPRAHGPVPCPRDPRAHGPNLPRAHGLIRMGGCDPQSEPLFIYFDP